MQRAVKILETLVVRNAFDAEDSFKILYFQILVW